MTNRQSTAQDLRRLDALRQPSIDLRRRHDADRIDPEVEAEMRGRHVEQLDEDERRSRYISEQAGEDQRTDEHVGHEGAVAKQPSVHGQHRAEALTLTAGDVEALP